MNPEIISPHQCDATASAQQSDDFVDYLRVLFPLIEGTPDPGKTRIRLNRYLREHDVPPRIRAMLEDLFLSRFQEPV